MKVLLLLFFLLPVAVSAQKAILIDRAFQNPVQVVDKVTMEEVTRGLMPVYIIDIDSILQIVEKLITVISQSNTVQGMLDLKAGQSRWTTRTEKHGRMKQYNIVLNTNFGLFETYLVVAANEPDKRALQRLTIFTDYLRNNRAILPEFSHLP